jgi:TRAP-type C4-dicarboxylate transport system permease small subunit
MERQIVKALLKKYDSCLFAIGIVELALGIICLLTIVVCIFGQVVSRYAFGKPLVWVEEFSTYCFIWSVYLGAAYALIKGRHIRVTTLFEKFPLKMQKVLTVLTSCSLMFFLIVLIRNGLTQFVMEGAQHTIALPVNLPRKYFFSVPFLISCFSMLITSIYFLLHQLSEPLQRNIPDTNTAS